MEFPETKLVHLSLCMKNDESTNIFVVVVATRNLISRYEISSDGNILDLSTLNLVDCSSCLVIDSFGDRIATCEGSYVVIRSDQLKRIRRFKLPRDEAPVAVIFLDAAIGKDYIRICCGLISLSYNN